MKRTLLSLSLVAGVATPALSHEFWIEPLAYQVPVHDRLQATLVNGQGFEGPTVAYFPQRFRDFSLHVGDSSAPVFARIGDSPALDTEAIAEGLTVVAYRSTVSIVNYDDWETFMGFVEHKDLGNVAARHAARGFTEDERREAYTRFSKSLIGVGNSDGSDARVGFETEIVALDNPYTDDLGGQFRVQVFYGDAVRAETQVEVFDRAPDQSVTISYERTDAEGIAVIPVTSGHEYMLDAVVLREPSQAIVEETGAQWETLWANLTFMVPG